VNGVVSAIDKVKGCEIINLGGEHPITLTEMVGVIEAVLNKKAKLKKLPMQPGDVLQTYADLAKARRLLNYTPKVPFSEGVRRYVAWWREQSKA
jgi:UDP-glucuronate 4-epimerase